MAEFLLVSGLVQLLVEATADAAVVCLEVRIRLRFHRRLSHSLTGQLLATCIRLEIV